MSLMHSIAQNFKDDAFMWPIGITSLIGIAVTFERFNYLRAAASIKKDEFLAKVNQHVMAGQIDKAISMCSQMTNPLTNIVRAGLISVSNGKDAEEVQTAMDAVALREIPKIEKRTGLLALLSNIATLLGLLGTVAGLIGAFAAVAGVSPSEKATLLAKSIATAMNCTAFGLIVAIPLLAAFGYLQMRSQELVDDIHEASVSTLNFILTNRDKILKKVS